ncbi:MAG TPA: Ig-like domain-containing protein [Flavobacteriaceae bacterium]|nr:Ig-like domain-containing protein [Flavobacteriaceae bacterium]
MKKEILFFFAVVCIFGAIFSCAKQGSPTGGAEDIDPPKFVRAEPENFSTNFKSDEIRIYFNEYIKLVDPQRQIILSPPMETRAIITPMGTPRKYVKIELNDTLQKNTTYTISFGKSIVDNNEENPLPFFKYVFSTGSYIDSLKISGVVHDALQKSPDEFISVMLYEVDSTYSDSLVFTKMPTYVSYSQDSTNAFQIENIKEGKYKLLALKDKNNNYKFEPSTDKIGFFDETISVPTDSVFHLTLFQEILDFKAERPKYVAQQHALFGYRGNADSMGIELLSDRPSGFQSRIVRDREKDTLHYFFKPNIEKDSLLFAVSNQNYRDTLTLYLRELPKDTLAFETSPKGGLGFDENFELLPNLPIAATDTTLISILNKDSLSVPFAKKMDFRLNKLILNFEKEEAQTYRVTFLPEAVTDFFGNVNDTLKYSLRTKKLSDYGILTMNIANIDRFPVIVQLTDLKGNVVKEVQSESGNVFNFPNISPGKYYLRLIYDDNQNGKWDTGNYLEHRQPEKVIYYPEILEVRANWDVMETFILK